MSANDGVIKASLAGIFAAFGGIFAKLALSNDSSSLFVRICDHYIPSSYNVWIVRGLFTVAALTFNSMMLTFTAKALQLCSTTVQSVVATSAVNFLISGLMGTFLLGEDLGFLGVVGMIFIQIGVLIISDEKEKTS